MNSSNRLRGPVFQSLWICGAIFVAALTLSSGQAAQSREREVALAPLAACPTLKAVLNTTLPVRIANGQLDPREGGEGDIFQRRVGEALAVFQAAKAARRADFYQRFPEGRVPPVDQASARARNENDRAHEPYLRRFQAAHSHLQGRLDLVRRASNRFWTRDYRPRGATQRVAPRDPEAEAMATDLAVRIVAEAGATDAQGDCRIVRDALIEAAALALISIAREQVRRDPRTDVAPDHLNAIASAERRLGLDDRPCATIQHCVLAAKIALLRAERQRGAGSAATELARTRIEDALRLSAVHGPSAATAEAWMAKAELEPVETTRGPVLNPRYVDNAFAGLQMLTPLQAAESAWLERQLPNQFRHRLLPIFQAAADSAYRRGQAGDASVRALIVVGEASRRAQIESVLGDACEPLDVPMAPRHLLQDETIVYPVVGAERTYMLVGTNSQDLRADRGNGDGWELFASDPTSGAAEVADRADKLVTRLDLAAAEFGGDNLQVDGLDWGSGDARWLHARLVAPLGDHVRRNANRRSHGQAVAEIDADAPTLIFFPDPALRNTPWALLHTTYDANDRRRTDYLVRSAAIAVAPALAYVRPLAQPQRRGGLLAGGLAEANLDLFVEELGNYGLAARLLDSLTGGEFTADNLRNRLAAGGASVLLLATHARFDGASSRIAVSAPMPSAAGAYGEFGIGEIERSIRQAHRRTRGLDLLILISCEGAVGDAGQLGLAGAALRGGAASTIGPIVSVAADLAPRYFAHPVMGGSRDEGQSRLDEAERPDAAFLTEYYRGHSPAQAMRRAQLAYLHPTASDYGHEANWGVFMVVGNWR